jgi:hypothetical protein
MFGYYILLHFTNFMILIVYYVMTVYILPFKFDNLYSTLYILNICSSLKMPAIRSWSVYEQIKTNCAIGDTAYVWKDTCKENVYIINDSSVKMKFEIQNKATALSVCLSARNVDSVPMKLGKRHLP